MTNSENQTARYPQSILGTVCVPWDEGYQLAEGVFRRQIRSLIESGLRDLYIFGTAGEGYAVSQAQFEKITRVFVEEMSALGAAPMVGVIGLSLSTIIERIEYAAEMGVRKFQLSLPSWGALSDSELQTFFRETCGRFPEYEFLHYNLLRTKRLVTPAEYASLSEKYESLVATKHGTSDAALAAGLLREAPLLRHFFTEVCFPYAAMLGQCGLLVSVASISPQYTQQYFEAGVKRDAERLMELQHEILAITAEMRKAMGPAPYIDGAYDKLFHRLHDPDFPLRLLPPYEGASEEAFAAFRDSLNVLFPHWMHPSAQPI